MDLKEWYNELCMKSKKNLLIEIVGWYGVLGILSAYALSTFAIIPVNGFWHQILNLTGSIGIIVVALNKRDYQPIVLNAIWGLVAIISLLSLLR